MSWMRFLRRNRYDSELQEEIDVAPLLADDLATAVDYVLAMSAS